MDPEIEIRRERVRRGSNRKRDVEAVKAADAALAARRRDERLAATRLTEAASDAWALVMGAYFDDDRRRWWHIQLEEVELAGEADGALVATAPESVVTWLRDRTRVGDTIRELTDYRGLYLYPAPEPEGPQEEDSFL